MSLSHLLPFTFYLYVYIYIYRRYNNNYLEYTMGKLERKITNEVFIYKIYYKLSSNVSLKKKKNQ